MRCGNGDEAPGGGSTGGRRPGGGNGPSEPRLPGVRVEIARRLPAPLRPARLVAVAALPRSPAGKVDLSALAELSEPPDERPPAPRCRWRAR